MEQTKCEGLISENKIYKVLKKMKNGKSPGTDGYTTEFYNFLRKDIGKFILDSLNNSFTNGELSITQKTRINYPNSKRKQTKRTNTKLSADYFA